jgi:glycosyltransferase involved in cell wall biosynthesis
VHRRSQATGLLSRVARRLNPSRKFAWLGQFNPSLCVISQGGAYDGVEWMEACRERGISYVTIAQLALDWIWPADRDQERLRSALCSAKHCYFVSEGNRRLVCTQLGIELPNSRVVRNPFGVRYDSPLPWRNANPYRLACVARLDPQFKGQDLLFQVLRQGKWKERPVKVTLYGNGRSKVLLESLREKWGLDMVSFGGFQQPADIWACEQILVLPSRHEGLPLVAVEAMLSGRPCIVTDVAGNTEVVEDGVSGFVAAASTAELLDEAMERAWACRQAWPKMGEAAARRIRELVPPDPVGCFVLELKRHLV